MHSTLYRSLIQALSIHGMQVHYPIGFSCTSSLIIPNAGSLFYTFSLVPHLWLYRMQVNYPIQVLLSKLCQPTECRFTSLNRFSCTSSVIIPNAGSLPYTGFLVPALSFSRMQVHYLIQVLLYQLCHYTECRFTILYTVTVLNAGSLPYTDSLVPALSLYRMQVHYPIQVHLYMFCHYTGCRFTTLCRFSWASSVAEPIAGLLPPYNFCHHHASYKFTANTLYTFCYYREPRDAMGHNEYKDLLCW